MTVSTTISKTLVAMDTAFSRLKAEMRNLEVVLSIWDNRGTETGESEACCEICRSIRKAADGLCQDDLARVARRVLDEGEPVRDRGSLGCCIVGVPVFQRRRLVGSGVGCFPVRQMLEGQDLRRLQDRLGCDRAYLDRLTLNGPRKDRREDGDYLRILDGLLKREQALQVARNELANLGTNLATTYEELSLVYRISGLVKVTREPRDFLQNVTRELLEVMNVESAAAVVYAHPPAVEEDLAVFSGSIELNAEQMLMLAATCICPRLKGNNHPVVDNSFVQRGGGGLGQAVRNYVAAPFVVDDRHMGMLIALNKLSGDFDSVDLKLVNSVANQSAVFLNNNKLYADLQDLLMGVLHALTASIDAKDPYTCGHSQRVALISRKLAQAMGFAPARVQQVYLSGLLHDIGKIGIPESILCKPGRLTAEEYDDLKRHPTISANILSGIRQLENVIPGILTHHERPDGKGYPQGLKGLDIPIEGSIVGIADSFDAMTSDRTYRTALPLPAAIQEIRSCAGTQFDVVVAEKMLSMDLEGFMQHTGRPATTVFPVNLSQESKT